MSDCLQQSEYNKLCINLTQAELNSVSLAETVLLRIDQAGIPRKQIELELSERFVADAVEELGMNTIHKLDAEGISFAFDDFGTGQSSLMHLSKFPGDTLKIDKSFIDEITTSLHQQRLVSGMIEFAHHLNMETIAEGVETEEQRALLTEMKCDSLQGYLLARPMPKVDVMRFLDNHQFNSPEYKLVVNS